MILFFVWYTTSQVVKFFVTDLNKWLIWIQISDVVLVRKSTKNHALVRFHSIVSLRKYDLCFCDDVKTWRYFFKLITLKLPRLGALRQTTEHGNFRHLHNSLLPPFKQEQMIAFMTDISSVVSSVLMTTKNRTSVQKHNGLISIRLQPFSLPFQGNL